MFCAFSTDERRRHFTGFAAAHTRFWNLMEQIREAEIPIPGGECGEQKLLSAWLLDRFVVLAG